ncbi:MAG: glycosyltransferase [Verrucomicrobia subdivision 3 bacterium]|nr:glycosyltransferase [Limisphaerales bacterium]
MERALHVAGVDVTVAATDDAGKGRREAVPLATPLQFNGATRLYFPKQTEFYKCSFPLSRWVSRNVRAFDVVHVHALFSHTSVAAASAARHQKVPYVVRPLGVLNRYGMTRRRRILKQISFRFIEGPLLRHAAAMHYTSDQERVEAEDAGATAPAAVLPIGLDLTLFELLPLPSGFVERWPQAKGREIVLFLSRLDAKKGLDLLIDALAELKKRRPAALLVIAGSGDEAFVRMLRERAEKCGVAGDVIWTGFLEGSAKLAAFAAANAFVLPSYSENFGIAAVEALAAGIPSVLTTGVGISDAVREAEAALVVAAKPSEIAKALVRILDDVVLARSLSANGRALANERYSLNAMGSGLRRLYEQIVNAER